MTGKYCEKLIMAFASPPVEKRTEEIRKEERITNRTFIGLI